jgi:hypothetical protein
MPRRVTPKATQKRTHKSHKLRGRGPAEDADEIRSLLTTARQTRKMVGKKYHASITTLIKMDDILDDMHKPGQTYDVLMKQFDKLDKLVEVAKAETIAQEKKEAAGHTYGMSYNRMTLGLPDLPYNPK